VLAKIKGALVTILILAPLLIAQLYSTAGRIKLSVLFLFRKKQIVYDGRKPRYIDLSFIYEVVNYS